MRWVFQQSRSISDKKKMSKNILKSEFIGKELSVVEADNKSLIGISGEIVDETKNSFAVRSASGVKMLLKSQITFVVENDGKKIKIEGKKLCFRPEERVKKIR